MDAKVSIVVIGGKVSYFFATNVEGCISLTLVRRYEGVFLLEIVGAVRGLEVYHPRSIQEIRNFSILSKKAELFELEGLTSEIDAREKISEILDERFSLLFT